MKRLRFFLALFITFIFCLSPSMTVFADDNPPTDDEIWIETNVNNFMFYDNPYTENSHIAVKPSGINDIIPIDMGAKYEISVTMRLDIPNQEVPKIKDDIFNSSTMYGYTISNALLKTSVSYLDLCNYETEGYSVDFIVTIKDETSCYTVNCVMPSLLEFEEFNNNMTAYGDLKVNQVNEKKIVASAVTLALFLTVIISFTIVAFQTRMERHNAKKRYVKSLYLPYQIFMKIKKNTDDDMIFRLQHTNKTGAIEYIALKRILEGTDIPSVISNEVEPDNDTEFDDKENNDNE